MDPKGKYCGDYRELKKEMAQEMSKFYKENKHLPDWKNRFIGHIVQRWFDKEPQGYFSVIERQRIFKEFLDQDVYVDFRDPMMERFKAIIAGSGKKREPPQDDDHSKEEKRNRGGLQRRMQLGQTFHEQASAQLPVAANVQLPVAIVTPSSAMNVSVGSVVRPTAMIPSASAHFPRFASSRLQDPNLSHAARSGILAGKTAVLRLEDYPSMNLRDYARVVNPSITANTISGTSAFAIVTATAKSNTNVVVTSTQAGTSATFTRSTQAVVGPSTLAATNSATSGAPGSPTSSDEYSDGPTYFTPTRERLAGTQTIENDARITWLQSEYQDLLARFPLAITFNVHNQSEIIGRELFRFNLFLEERIYKTVATAKQRFADFREALDHLSCSTATTEKAALAFKLWLLASKAQHRLHYMTSITKSDRIELSIEHLAHLRRRHRDFAKVASELVKFNRLLEQKLYRLAHVSAAKRIDDFYGVVSKLNVTKEEHQSIFQEYRDEVFGPPPAPTIATAAVAPSHIQESIEAAIEKSPAERELDRVGCPSVADAQRLCIQQFQHLLTKHSDRATIGANIAKFFHSIEQLKDGKDLDGITIHNRCERYRAAILNFLSITDADKDFYAEAYKEFIRKTPCGYAVGTASPTVRVSAATIVPVATSQGSAMTTTRVATTSSRAATSTLQVAASSATFPQASATIHPMSALPDNLRAIANSDFPKVKLPPPLTNAQIQTLIQSIKTRFLAQRERDTLRLKDADANLFYVQSFWQESQGDHVIEIALPEPFKPDKRNMLMLNGHVDQAGYRAIFGRTWQYRRPKPLVLGDPNAKKEYDPTVDPNMEYSDEESE